MITDCGGHSSLRRKAQCALSDLGWERWGSGKSSLDVNQCGDLRKEWVLARQRVEHQKDGRL